MSREEVLAYIAAQRPEMAAALTDLRTRLAEMLPGHGEVLSYAMPGFRQPGPGGKMVIGYAAFAHHLGVYPHSGSIIPQLDCTPFKTSKSGVLFAPGQRLPDALLHAIVTLRQAEIAAGRRPPRASPQRGQPG